MATRTYILLVSALVLLLAPLAIKASAGEDDSNPPGSQAVQVANIEPEAREALEVLEQDRSSSTDPLPEEYASQMDRRARFGMNLALSRRAIANLTSSVYVIPARDHVCASLTDPYGVTTICPPTADIAAGKVGAATVAFETGGVAVYGIVPDGVESIFVKTEGAHDVQVPTENNAYYAVIPAGTTVRAIGYTGPSGPVEFAIADPADVLER